MRLIAYFLISRMAKIQSVVYFLKCLLFSRRHENDRQPLKIAARLILWKGGWVK